MSSVNKVILVGRLGKDPEAKTFADGGMVTNFSLATSERWKDKQGEQQEKTEWHRIAMFGKVAEIAEKYLQKGSLVYIEGKLQTRKWTDKDGVERYSTEVIGDRMQMLGSKPDGDREERAPRGSSSKPAPQQSKSGSKFDDFEDDIPF